MVKLYSRDLMTMEVKEVSSGYAAINKRIDQIASYPNGLYFAHYSINKDTFKNGNIVVIARGPYVRYFVEKC